MTMKRLLILLVGLTLVAGPAYAQDADTTLGKGKVIALDYFYNHQEKNGKPFHYIWDDKANSGYSKFGDVWQQYGATLAKVEEAPTPDDLSHYSVYIICCPNTPDKAADGKPNYISEPAISAIADWVKNGGVLAMFANDVHNCEFDHYDQLATKFGITFNKDIRNAPIPTKAQMGLGVFTDFPDHPIFQDVHMIYMKEICTLEVTDPATALLTAPKQTGTGTDIIMASSHYGKGLVFAVGDPWIYNEYIDVKTAKYPVENRKAGENLVQWLLQAASVPQAK
jgi:unsaturated rhamnogalacturonyl hydrolase